MSLAQYVTKSYYQIIETQIITAGVQNKVSSLAFFLEIHVFEEFRFSILNSFTILIFFFPILLLMYICC